MPVTNPREKRTSDGFARTPTAEGETRSPGLCSLFQSISRSHRKSTAGSLRLCGPGGGLGWVGQAAAFSAGMQSAMQAWGGGGAMRGMALVALLETKATEIAAAARQSPAVASIAGR